MEAHKPREAPSPARGFSLAERDRRWGLIRGLMSDGGIDILIAVGEADSRYISQMASGVGPTIVPMTGEVTGLNKGHQDQPLARTWLEDLRSVESRWRDGITKRLAELDADRAIIGIAGLDGSSRRPDGDFNYTTFVGLREAFPHARWVAATTLMQEARYRKSDEEIECLQQAAAVADAGLLAAADRFSQGSTDRDIWGQMLLAMASAGAERPTKPRLILADVSAPTPALGAPVGDRARSGHVLVNQADGIVQGYRARALQLAVLGRTPSDWRDAWSAHIEVWEQTLDLLRPGASLHEVAHATEGAALGKYAARQSFRGQGLGDDVTVLPATPPEEDRRLEEGACLVVISRVAWGDPGREKVLTWGDAVAITQTGSRRLGTRPHTLITYE